VTIPFRLIDSFWWRFFWRQCPSPFLCGFLDAVYLRRKPPSLLVFFFLSQLCEELQTIPRYPVFPSWDLSPATQKAFSFFPAHTVSPNFPSNGHFHSCNSRPAFRRSKMLPPLNPRPFPFLYISPLVAVSGPCFEDSLQTGSWWLLPCWEPKLFFPSPLQLRRFV